MTSFFKAIFIELQRDPHVYPTGNLIEFRPNASTNAMDGIECKRAGDTAVKAKIILFPDYVPDRFKVSKELSSLIGVEEESKNTIILYLWKYIKVLSFFLPMVEHHLFLSLQKKLYKLQSTEDRRKIKCDEHMKKVCLYSLLLCIL